MNSIPRTIWEKKLPPFSGLILVLALLLGIGWLTGNVVLFGTRAALGGEPQNVQITNITDTSFTVTYKTEVPVLGSVKYGTGQALDASLLDDRDQVLNKTVEHKVHHITIKGLTPSTKYLFEIASGGETYRDSGVPYEIITAPPLSAQINAPPPLKGQVELEDGTLPGEGIAYVTTGDSQTLSAMLQPDGSYTIPLEQLRTTDLTTWAQLSETTELRVTIESGDAQSSAVVLASQSEETPLMVLSNNYDFSLDSSLAADASGSAQASPSGAVQPAVELPVPQDTTVVNSPTITVPEAGQSFTDTQPMFEGKGVVGTAIEITMELQPEIKAVVQADENGNWKYRPDTPLTPGQQSITIKAQDAQGTQQTVTQAFTVTSEGSQFVEPSVSPPVVQPTPVVLPTTTTAPTIEPTVTEAPTPTPTIASAPTIDPNSFTPTPDPNANKGVPTVPDSGTSAWMFGLAGVVFAAGVGVLLFFFI